MNRKFARIISFFVVFVCLFTNVTAEEIESSDDMDLITLKAAVNQAKKEIGTPTDAQVGSAVNNYLQKNPVQAYDDTKLKTETNLLKENIDNIRTIIQPSPQLVDKAQFKYNKRPATPALSGINEIVDENGWVMLDPIIYLDGEKRLATNLPAGFVFLGYREIDGALKRDEFVQSVTFDTVDNHYEHTFNTQTAAIRVYGGSRQLAEMSENVVITYASTWDSNAYDYNPNTGVTLNDDVKTPRIDAEVKRLDYRIDDVSADSGFPFLGKTIVGIGDSIMVGINADGTAVIDGTNSDGTPCTEQGLQYNSTGGFLGQIRDKYPSINVINMGVGSTTMQRNDAVAVNVAYKCIADRIDNIPDEADIIILEGGLNDFYHADKGCSIGTYEENLYKYPVGAYYKNGAYSGVEWTVDTRFNIEQFCGSLEISLTKLLVRFIGKPIIYVIPHNPSSASGIDEIFDAATSICEKYGVPVVDVRKYGRMPRIYAIAGNSDGTSALTVDGVHPNAEGYRVSYMPLIIDMLKRIMN